MQIHRSRTLQPPYELLFEQNQRNGFYESTVAGQALGINAIIQDAISLTDEEALRWANLSRRIGFNPEIEKPQIERVDREELRTIGQALLFYADRTKFDLSGMSAPTGILASIRRVEGDMALNMAHTISSRVHVPKTSFPDKLYNFSPWYS